MIKSAFVAALSLAAGSLTGCSTKTPPVTYHQADQPYVTRALAFYSGHGRIGAPQVKRQMTAVVVHLPTMICVGLNLKRGMAGGDTTVCYSAVTGQQILTYVDGD